MRRHLQSCGWFEIVEPRLDIENKDRWRLSYNSTRIGEPEFGGERFVLLQFVSKNIQEDSWRSFIHIEDDMFSLELRQVLE